MRSCVGARRMQTQNIRMFQHVLYTSTHLRYNMLSVYTCQQLSTFITSLIVLIIIVCVIIATTVVVIQRLLLLSQAAITVYVLSSHNVRSGH